MASEVSSLNHAICGNFFNSEDITIHRSNIFSQTTSCIVMLCISIEELFNRIELYNSAEKRCYQIQTLMNTGCRKGCLPVRQIMVDRKGGQTIRNLHNSTQSIFAVPVK